MKNYIEEFLFEVRSGNIEIYNEFSLQHELGIFLRNKISDYNVQFERNVSHFGFDKHNYVKKEIDIAVFSPNLDALECVIELKYPRNGQVPEQIFSFCKDICFCEQLCRAGFKKTFALFLAEDKNFYSGKDFGIFSFFRGGKIITGQIQKPTGSKNEKVHVAGNYQADWKPVIGGLKYVLIEIGKTPHPKSVQSV